jgi:hypothetical protein
MELGMLIEFPVTIAFDVLSGGLTKTARPEKRTFTMRYDDSDIDRVPEYTFDVPPRPNSTWFRDESETLLDVMPEGMMRLIERRAYADPETYCSDPDERERRLKEVA